MFERGLLLVCGESLLANHPGAEEFCKAILRAKLAWLGQRCSGQCFVLHGGADGPEQWASAVARERGDRSVVYRSSGYRFDSHRPRRRWISHYVSRKTRDRALLDVLQSRTVDWLTTEIFFVTDWASNDDTDFIFSLLERERRWIKEVVVPETIPLLAVEGQGYQARAAFSQGEAGALETAEGQVTKDKTPCAPTEQGRGAEGQQETRA